MGLGLRRWICGRGSERAPAPPSSAEGERCGRPGPRDALWGTGGSRAGSPLALDDRSGARGGSGAGEAERLRAEGSCAGIWVRLGKDPGGG